jgi:adenine deaminase
MARPPASAHVLAVARGDEPADLLITGGSVFVPSTKEWIATSLAIADGVIAGWGDRDAHTTTDVGGAALTPGLIDAHMHLESTKLWLDEFVAAVLPHGTTAVAGDPHEMANVLGVKAIEALADAAKQVPFTFKVYASSCVPASPYESAGASLDHNEIARLLEDGTAEGVAEVMNYPGVIHGDPEILARIHTAGPKPTYRVDGHSPGLRGRLLDAYLAAGVESDHECTTLEEALEKRRKGMWVFLREGSASRNLIDLAPLVTRYGPANTALCTDDREPSTLLSLGHINDCCRIAVAHGIDEKDAILLASTNPARYHGFTALGDLGPGFQADIVAFAQLSTWEPTQVWQKGRHVASNGQLIAGVVPKLPAPASFRHTVNVGALPEPQDLILEFPPGTNVRAVGVESHTLTTANRELKIGDPELNHAAVIERHHATGKIGRGFTVGFGLKRGAIASTVAHDAHNIVVVGANGPDMATAVARLSELGGGQIAILDGQVIGEVPLPLAGLMSDRPAHEVGAQIAQLNHAIATQLGTTTEEPFMQLSFIALSVIPNLRLTDGGLVDVNRFEFVPVTIDG